MRPATKGKILVFGLMFNYPLAGATYQFLHYLIGLRRLGYDPYYVEDSSRWVFNPRLGDTTPEALENITAVAPILEEFGFKGRWAFRENYPGGRCYGLTEERLLQLYREADACLNVSGGQEMREEQKLCPRRIYVESDPFGAQVCLANGHPGITDLIAAHNVHFSFGENIGAADCGIPATPFNWLPTRQPVVLDLWNSRYEGTPESFGTITTWHNEGKDVTYQGEVFYWTKDRSFQKFIDLPQRSPARFKMAVTNADEHVRSLLRAGGWELSDALEVSKSMASYHDYIQSCRGEFTVARDQYVRPKTGWFSDRTACFLAAGKPVITEETGFSKYLPTGKGLFGFEGLDDVLAAIDQIESDYEGHCEAAREIAAEYFSAEQVIASLMSRAGLA